MLSVAILAAGKGTRMESSIPKVLHKISGKSLLQRVIDTCIKLNPDQIFVITGHKSKEVEKSLPNDKKIHVVIQEPQSGTGHAIQVLCKEVKKHEGKLLVLNGDVPLIRPSTLKRLLYLHDSKNADVSLINLYNKEAELYPNPKHISKTLIDFPLNLCKLEVAVNFDFVSSNAPNKL